MLEKRALCAVPSSRAPLSTETEAASPWRMPDVPPCDLLGDMDISWARIRKPWPGWEGANALSAEGYSCLPAIGMETAPLVLSEDPKASLEIGSLCPFDSTQCHSSYFGGLYYFLSLLIFFIKI